jgi:hypothetical protein
MKKTKKPPQITQTNELKQMALKRSKWQINKKKYVTSLCTKEMQIKITLRFHLLPVRIAIIKKTNSNESW